MSFSQRGKVFIAMIGTILAISGCTADSSEFALRETTGHSISGMVNGSVLQGVTITLTGAANATTTTDTNGNYRFEGMANGDYTLTPTLAGYIFNPASTAVKTSGLNANDVNFAATASAAPTYRISGTVNGAVLQSVTIMIAGAANATTLTDASGKYSFTGLVSGSYTVTPALAGYLFVSASEVITVSNANVTGINFAAMSHAGPTYSISGAVSGYVQQGVMIRLSGTSCASTLTDASGKYSFVGLASGDYSVLPAMGLTCDYVVTPKATAVTISSSNVTGIDYTSAAGNPCVGSGTVVSMQEISGNVSGSVRQGVTIIVTGPICAITTTDTIGNYAFAEYFVSGNYTITPAMVGHTFSPTGISVIFFGIDLTGKNFTAF